MSDGQDRTPGMKILLGHSVDDGSLVELPIEGLLRHVIVLGSSGSGKTHAAKSIVEQAVIAGVPVIAIDPQGDIASLGIQRAPSDILTDGIGETEAAYWARADVKIWTPASTAGIPLSLAPSVDVTGIARKEDQIRAYAGVAASISALTGYSVGGEMGEAATAAFSTVLEYADEYGLALETIRDFMAFLEDPPGALRERLDPIFGTKDRAKAAKRLRIKVQGAGRLLFDLGSPVDIAKLLGYDRGGARDQGRTRVSVIYLNTLTNQDEKEAFVSSIAHSLYSWMVRNPRPTPQALFYLDEAAPYLPPTRKPASKDALMMLARQSRKYGVGCLFATQSPGDIDYKALGQAGTWMLGRMSTSQEAAKVEPALSSYEEADVRAVLETLPGLVRGRFVLSSPDHFAEPIMLSTLPLVTNHQTLNPDKVERIVPPADRAYYGQTK